MQVCLSLDCVIALVGDTEDLELASIRQMLLVLFLHVIGDEAVTRFERVFSNVLYSGSPGYVRAPHFDLAAPNHFAHSSSRAGPDQVSIFRPPSLCSSISSLKDLQSPMLRRASANWSATLSISETSTSE